MRFRNKLARAAVFSALLPVLCAGYAGAVWAAPDVPPGAFGEAAHDRDEARVAARLLIDAEQVRAGETFRAGVLFSLDPGWHIYWSNPGESGLPTEVLWQVDQGEAGPMQWPAPVVFREADGFITTYGYKDEVLLFHDLEFARGASGTRVIQAEARFLVCEVQCIPGSILLERTVQIGDRTTPARDEVHDLFERAAKRVPRPAADVGLSAEVLYSQSAIRPGDEFSAALGLIPASDTAVRVSIGTSDPAAAFAPDQLEGLTVEAVDSREHPLVDAGVLYKLAGRASSDADAQPGRLTGVALLRGADGDPLAVRVDVALPRAATGAEITTTLIPWPVADKTAAGMPGGVEGPALSLVRAILFALIGGLILNLMPCVLPVLAIKVFGVAELAHENRRAVIASGVAYTAGIVFSMAALAGVVIGLRSAGTAVGWGFQFQEPLFVVGIAAVLVLFALNMFGVFEIVVNTARLGSVGQSGSATRRSFFEGLLAVVVATPCSAPFLGTAVGLAFASPPYVIFTIFIAIGLGLAAPFVAVTLVPGWARVIPKSGPWMVQLRRVLGFALIATVVWLLWVIGRSTGTDGLVATLAFLVALAFAAWVFGAFQASGRDRVGWIAGVGVAALAILWIGANPPAHADVAVAKNSNGHTPFARAAVDAELSAGRPVFVYFTADWCLTCKVNEAHVLTDARVLATLERLGYRTFTADWTRRDETIRAELARFGKAGVPMYLVYDPSAPDQPAVLPELLTVDLLVEALQKAAATTVQARVR